MSVHRSARRSRRRTSAATARPSRCSTASTSRVRARRDGGDRRRERRGQEHAAAPPRRARPADRRRRADRRASDWSALDDDAVSRAAEPHGRLRVSVSSSPARVHGDGERHDAAADRRDGRRRTRDARARALLERVGLAGRMHHRPAALSGGEQQRTAVARALAADPAVLLADEPSGNLDHANSERLHDLFAELARELGSRMVVVTHNRSLAARARSAASAGGLGG